MPDRPHDRAERQTQDRPNEGDQARSAQDVRQGEIILRTRRRRWIFFGGLIAAVVLALVAASLFP